MAQFCLICSFVCQYHFSKKKKKKKKKGIIDTVTFFQRLKGQSFEWRVGVHNAFGCLDEPLGLIQYVRDTHLKVPLRRKFCIPFSLQLLKVEVINTYHAKFYIEIPTGRPVILNVKFSFVLPPLLDSKNGREPHRELDLVAPRGI